MIDPGRPSPLKHARGFAWTTLFCDRRSVRRGSARRSRLRTSVCRRSFAPARSTAAASDTRSSKVPRGRRKRQVNGSHPASEPAHVLPVEQGPRRLRGGVQPDTLRAGEVRPLCATRASELAGDLSAIRDAADRRHVDGKLMEDVAAFAQFDNDVRSERTRGGMKAAPELGRWTFLAPLTI